MTTVDCALSGILSIFPLIHTNESFLRKLFHFVSSLAEDSPLFSDMTPRQWAIISRFFETNVVTKNREVIIQRPGIIFQNNGILYLSVVAYLFDEVSCVMKTIFKMYLT
jgi:hypothetical protein